MSECPDQGRSGSAPFELPEHEQRELHELNTSAA
jgi:hypothetical protein